MTFTFLHFLFLFFSHFKSSLPSVSACLVMSNHTTSFLSSLPACEKEVQKVCANSTEENLQPFQDKMEGFISAGEWN